MIFIIEGNAQCYSTIYMSSNLITKYTTWWPLLYLGENVIPRVALWIVIWPHYITSQWVSAASCLYCLVLKSYSYGMGSRRIWNSGKSQKRFFAGNYLFWPGILFELSNVRLCHHITVSFCCQLSVLPCIVLPSSTLFGVTVTWLDYDDNDDHCECDHSNSANVSIIFPSPPGKRAKSPWRREQMPLRMWPS